LRMFLADPDVPLETNHVERALRCIPMGKRNGLFSWTEIGAPSLNCYYGLYTDHISLLWFVYRSKKKGFVMTKASSRIYSHYTREALELLAALIRETRLEKKITAQELADRAGISRGLLQRIEKADPSCAIGSVFEVASLLGLALFDSDEYALSNKRLLSQEKLALMPKSVRKPRKEADDDF